MYIRRRAGVQQVVYVIFYVFDGSEPNGRKIDSPEPQDHMYFVQSQIMISVCI